MNDVPMPPRGPKAAGVIEALERLPEAELQAVVKRAQALLAARAQERRREALREIQRLAREHGLQVDVKEPARKRGRPPKGNG